METFKSFLTGLSYLIGGLVVLALVLVIPLVGESLGLPWYFQFGGLILIGAFLVFWVLVMVGDDIRGK